MFCEGCVVKDKLGSHFSLQRALYFMKRALHFVKRAMYEEMSFAKANLSGIIFHQKSEKIHVFHEKSPVVAGLFFVYKGSSFTRATLSAIILHEKSHASQEKSPVAVELFILLKESFFATATLCGINPVASCLQNSFRTKRAMYLMTRALHPVQKSPISISHKKCSVSHLKSLFLMN